jgi:hypothetical protein
VSAIFETNESVTREATPSRWSPLSLLCLAFPLTFDPSHRSNQSVDSLIRGDATMSSSSITDYKEK